MTAAGGVARLMNVQGREGGEELLTELRKAGDVRVEPMGLVNNFGRSELLLTTFLPGVR